MKQPSIISARARLSRLLEEIPDEWLEALLLPVILLIARLRRFFAATGDAAGRLAAGMGAGGHALGTGTPVDRTGL